VRLKGRHAFSNGIHFNDVPASLIIFSITKTLTKMKSEPTLKNVVVCQRASRPKDGKAFFSEPLENHFAVVSLPYMFPDLFVGMSIMVEGRQGLQEFGVKLIDPDGKIMKEIDSAFINPDSWNGDQFTEVLPLFPTTFTKFGEHHFNMFINRKHISTLPFFIIQEKQS
jgi:hypothetical protein